MKAIALFSGGLDSMLAMKIISSQNIEVIALHINIGFGGKKDIRETLKKRALLAGAKLHIEDVREDYIKNILFSPKYGYGKNFNPCIDCHGYMFTIGKELMKKMDASFLITGEVVGQRPMSQRPDAMQKVLSLANDKEEKLILRPLSAKIMKETTPELKGWVDREKLYDFNGRGRNRQLALAKSFGWEDFEAPAGGCLLTEVIYSQRIREFIEYEKDFTIEDSQLLKFGRHFRLPNSSKLIVGKHKEDNESIKNIKTDKYIPILLPISGPFSIISKNSSKEDKELGAKIAITYTKSDFNLEYKVKIEEEIFIVKPFKTKEEAQKYFFNAKS